MLKKITFYVLFFCFLTVFHINAANVSFLIIEAGLPNNGRAHQYSTMWENGLLDVFFESGHIVSNAPVMRLPTRPDNGFPFEAERHYENAKTGGIEYFIIAIINYPVPGSANSLPLSVALRLFNTESENMIHERVFSGLTQRTTRDEYEIIKKSIKEFAATLD